MHVYDLAATSRIHKIKTISTKLINQLLMGCIASLLLLRDIGGVSITRFVFIILAALVCMRSRKSGIYCLMAFLTPLATGISCTYITAIALVVLITKQPRLRMQSLGIVCMAIILLMELFSAFRGRFSFVEYLRFSSIFIFSFLRIFDLEDNYDNTSILNYFLIGFWVAMTSIFGQMLNVYSLQQIVSLNVRFGDTRQILNIAAEGMLVSYNPNGLGILCLLSAFFCLLLFQKRKNKIYLISFGGSTFLGIMTQSRAFILIYVLGMILFAILSSHSIKSALKSMSAIAIGGGTVIGLSKWLIPVYVNNLLLRFQVSDLLNGRGEITSYYFEKMFQHIDRLLFGVGLQNYQEKYNYYMSAHNATQEVIIAWGLLGFMLVVSLFLAVFLNGYIRNPKAKLVQYLPLVIYLIVIQSGQGFSDTSGMLRIMVAYSAILLPLKGGDGLFERKQAPILES